MLVITGDTWASFCEPQNLHISRDSQIWNGGLESKCASIENCLQKLATNKIGRNDVDYLHFILPIGDFDRS